MQRLIEKLKAAIMSESYEDRAGRSVISVKSALDIVDRLAAEQPKGGWIYCSEKMPEDGQDVIFTDKDGNVLAGYYDEKRNWCVTEEFFPNAFYFIAWQPMPEKAEEEQHEAN